MSLMFQTIPIVLLPLDEPVKIFKNEVLNFWVQSQGLKGCRVIEIRGSPSICQVAVEIVKIHGEDFDCLLVLLHGFCFFQNVGEIRVQNQVQVLLVEAELKAPYLWPQSRVQVTRVVEVLALNLPEITKGFIIWPSESWVHKIYKKFQTL